MLPRPPISTLFPYTTLFRSGSNACDAMVIIPCSMGTLGRIAHGYGEDVLLRAADVMLKEKKKLILVPRETRSEEHTSELQSLRHLVCRLLLEQKKNIQHDRR